MKRDNPWMPKAPLELRSWSLLPNVGMSERAGWVAVVAWAVYGLAFAVIHFERWTWIALCAIVGAFCVRYVTQRLGGRATRLRTGPEVSAEAPLYVRLISDVCGIGTLVYVAIAILRA